MSVYADSRMNKTSVLLSILLLLSACASSNTDFIDERTLDCESGQEVSIQAGLDIASAGSEVTEDMLTMLVDVGNNSHDDIVVKFIRVDQATDESEPYRLRNGYGTFEQTIPEGENHVFKIPMTGRLGPRNDQTIRSRRGLQLNVRVGLANGDSYHCQFLVPSPRQ